MANPGIDYALLRCIRTIEKNIKKCCNGRSVAILATGGLDSSLLAYLARKLKPTLYFAAIIDGSTLGYNKYSIKKCRLIAKIFSLKLKIIIIKKEDYLRSLFKVTKILGKPLKDYDLPAVYFLFKKIKDSQGSGSCVLSGLAMNELFNLPKDKLNQFLGCQITPEIHKHKEIAKSIGLEFSAPYINKYLIRYIFSVELRKRKGKTPLIETLKTMKVLPGVITAAAPLHSTIPASFICGNSFKEAQD